VRLLHLTFQEYLAGLHAACEGKAGELVKQVGKSWWRETILIAAAIGSKDFATRFFTALVNSDAITKEGAFLDQCLDEARYAVLDPFLAALTKEGATLQRQLDLLRRMRTFFEHPDVQTACRKLAGSPQPELASLACEILQRAGIVVERPVIQVMGAPLESRVDRKTGLALVSIPAGEFDMGSNDGDSDEKPVHSVRLTKAFWLGKYPVTNAEYQRFLEANSKAQPPSYWTDSRFNDPQQPVVGVSWDDAQAYCVWAGCRLPTEAEWEYACRAGTRTAFYFGESLSSKQANFDGNYPYGGAEKGPYLQKTSPVGSYQPNKFGLYDMHGNVWEWCQDWYGPYPKGSVTDPPGVMKVESRVLRGGSWFGDPTLLRSAYRGHLTPDFRDASFGFRCVLAGGSSPKADGFGAMPGGEALSGRSQESSLPAAPAPRRRRGKDAASGRGR